MNRADLVDSIAQATGQTKANVSHTLSALLHCVTGALMKGERVTLVGFGTFERRNRRARVGVNPQNPSQKLRIDAAKVPAFRAGQELKDIVDGRARMPGMPKSAMPAAQPKKAAPGKMGKAAPAKKKSAKKRKR